MQPSNPGVAMPLVDLLRRGDAPRDLKWLAARGAATPRLDEQLTLLVLLAEDADEELREMAEETLARLGTPALEAFLGRPGLAPEVVAFFSARGIVPSSPAPEEAGGEEGHRAAVARIALLDITERQKLAMTGSREERSILIRDPNKIVSVAVLESPKVQDSEIESFAKMTNVSDEVLRIIGTTRAWLKSYAVVAALVRNPKTPISISLTLLHRLNDRDVRLLTNDRNVPEPLRVAARKRRLAAEG